MTRYEQFKELWLNSIGNPATGYDGDQESIIKSAYIEYLEKALTLSTNLVKSEK
jgi:hypothetical protein